MSLVWERIEDFPPSEFCAITRAKVHGGWLVRSMLYMNSGLGSIPEATGITFVPDERHVWEV